MNKFLLFLFFSIFTVFTSLCQGLMINGGAFLVISPNTHLTISGNSGNFTNQSDKTVIDGNLNLQGNFNSDSYAFNSTGTITFNGNIAQSISAGDNSFYNIVFNKAGSNLDINLLYDLSITNTATFSNGIVNLSGRSLTFYGDNATSNGGSRTSFVDGQVTKTGANSSTFTFPIGKGLIWAPISIGTTANPTAYIDATYFRSDPGNTFGESNMCGGYANLNHVSGVEYWQLSQTGGAPYPAVTIHWKDLDAANNPIYHGISNTADLVVAHWENCGGQMKWDNKGGMVSGNASVGSVTSSFTFNNKITLGSKTNTNPLPVELLNFEGYCINNITTLNWSTASETNNSYFTVERSYDAMNWSELAQIPGAGNSNELRTYTFSDEYAPESTLYYRLKQTDFDGNFKYFTPISVACYDSENNIQISVSPNPFTCEITLDIQYVTFPALQVSIMDMLGNHIAVRNFPDITQQSLKTHFDLSALAGGMYFIEVRSAGFSRNIKIVKQ